MDNLPPLYMGFGLRRLQRTFVLLTLHPTKNCVLEETRRLALKHNCDSHIVMDCHSDTFARDLHKWLTKFNNIPHDDSVRILQELMKQIEPAS